MLAARRAPGTICPSGAAREVDPENAVAELHLGHLDLAFLIDYPDAREPWPASLALHRIGTDTFRLAAPAGQFTQRSVALASLAAAEVISHMGPRPETSLKALAEKHKSRLEVLTEPAEIGTRLPRAHFALTGGDGLSLEMACVGVPQLVITQNARHVPNAKELDLEGAATYLGKHEQVSPTTLRDAVNYVLDDQLERIGMSRCARQLIDGRGPDRIVNGLEILIHRPAAETGRRSAA